MDINKLAGKFDELKAGLYKHSYIQMTDANEIIVDRCDKVTTYDENIIKLRLVNNTLIITGAELKMRNFSNDGVIISGEIHSMEFSGE